MPRKTKPEVHYWRKREESGLVRVLCDILVPTDTKVRHCTIFYSEITCEECKGIYEAEHPDPDTWPLQVGEDYGSYGLMCGGHVAGRESEYFPGHVFSADCRATISGSTLAEIRASLEQHLQQVRHVPHPMLKLNADVQRTVSKERSEGDER